MQWYYCRDGKTVEGPIMRDDLIQMFSDEKLPPDTVVVAEGEQEWRALGSVIPVRSAAPPPLPQQVDHAANLLSVMSSLFRWFSSLKLRWRLALTGLVLLALFSGLGSHETSSETARGNSGSDRMTEEESEAMYRNAMAILPNKQHTCTVCGGSGQVANTTVRPRTGLTGSSEGQCETCHGNGSIRTPSGYDAVCPTCAGLGGRRTTPCRNCQGQGMCWVGERAGPAMADPLVL